MKTIKLYQIRINGAPEKRGFLSWHAILLTSKLTISTIVFLCSGMAILVSSLAMYFGNGFEKFQRYEKQPLVSLAFEIVKNLLKISPSLFSLSPSQKKGDCVLKSPDRIRAEGFSFLTVSYCVENAFKGFCIANETRNRNAWMAIRKNEIFCML